MAQLTQTPKSKSKRPRVQFSMNRELFATYQQIMALAEKHRIAIDFRTRFRRVVRQPTEPDHATICRA